MVINLTITDLDKQKIVNIFLPILFSICMGAKKTPSH